MPAYASPRNIQRWLLAGSSPRTLALEIGALLLHPEADAGSLDDMRALLHRHTELLQDTAKWPVPHVVEQLAAQDLGASVLHDETDGSGEGICRLIECITPSSATGEYGRLVNAAACRWSESSEYPTPYVSNPLMNPIPSFSLSPCGGAGAGSERSGGPLLGPSLQIAPHPL